ncbi:protein FAR1-RELATED SEQUENCE 5-like isoform X3 [Malania oleifera]|uniref:protein FAR1-RELATED SEQUENCE 5-like isoform X3 n=1 Tax=Malania oleifera TaxID=397392 RepID=UPI0025AE13B5|nr:protein FAR1-RELATED SEQUENCE 5-like isoform X3 [Malania oleifera]
MDGNGDDLYSPHEDGMENGLQTSNKLDLNLEQESRSPKVASVDAMQSSFSSKDEAGIDGVLKIGMDFESDEHAYRFYNKYAGLIGFSVRKDWVNRSKVHGQVVSRKFTCSKEGYRRKDKRDVNVKKHRKETRTGCLAHMIITRQPDSKYRITHFEAKHNHEFMKPSNALPSQNNLILAQGVEVDSTNNCGRQSKLTFEMMGRRFGDLENLYCPSIDHESNLQSERTRDIKQGEAGCLLHYFQRQHFENPLFFYATQLDVDDKVTNVFWADDNMVGDYDHFGDVVCVDTSCRSNKDFRPFVQFVGVNHHKEVVIFGAALLYDETVESLKWLFRTFVEAMSGKKPKAILTDQDAAIVEAIASVLPETDHRVCVWQMYQNALKHLSHVVKDITSFAKDFRSCIYDHEDEEDFVHAWEAMLDKFGLQQNEWLRWMFREREKWGVVYGRNTFFVNVEGMHLVESLSNNLRDYLKSDIDMLEFFKQFERAVDEQRCKELEASFDMSRCMPKLMANVVLLKHASDFYTPKAFEVFQKEYERCLNVVVNKCNENSLSFEYKANKFGKSREQVVIFNSSDNTVSCNCMKFESVGVLCSHALKVLDHRNIKVIPSQYILKRWMKDARVESARDSSGCTVQENHKLVATRRYKNLCHSILKISARASQSEQAFQFAMTRLDELICGVEKILNMEPSEEAQAITSSSTGANAYESEHGEIFLDRNAIEAQEDTHQVTEAREKELVVPHKGQPRNCTEKRSKIKGFQDVQPPASNTSVSCSPPTSCSPPAYIPSETPTPNSVTQDLFNFEANQVVQCMFQPPNLVMDQHSHPNMYSSPDIFSNQHNPPSQPQLLQESVPNSTQLRQAMELDVQLPHSSSFLHYDQRYRASDTRYFGSK